VWSHRSMRRYAGTGTAVLHDDDERRHARRVAGGHRPVGACLGGRHVVEQFMVKGERGGQGSRTVPVTIEDPALVPMSKAERAAAVSVLVGILTDWWARHGGEDRRNGADSPLSRTMIDALFCLICTRDLALLAVCCAVAALTAGRSRRSARPARLGTAYRRAGSAAGVPSSARRLMSTECSRSPLCRQPSPLRLPHR
jgi:hypothetical protein